MQPRFSILICSRDRNDADVVDSKFSTERSPVTALLFDAKRTVPLPILGQDSSLLAEIMSAQPNQLCTVE